MSSRAEFSEPTKRACAERVGFFCSNPRCRNPTVGPNEDEKKSTTVGYVAHICAASKNGPRFDPEQSEEDRKSLSNAIWLCGKCHPLVDKDWKYYPASTLRGWKLDAEKKARRAIESGRAPVPQPSTAPWRVEKWVHETTNDDRYVERADYIAQLSAWFNDPKCKCISLVGLGGIGKTSLVGYWLKTQNGRLDRDLGGLFYWSFYAERNVDTFFTSLLSFLNEANNSEIKPNSDLPLHEVLLREIPRLQPLAIVFDGLEVLQEPAEQRRAYGEFIDAGLRDFLLALVTTKKDWIAILTSRFPLTDLNRSRGVRRLRVERVTPDEGAEILHQQGVYGIETDRQNVSDCLEGHPLALRLFAATLPSSLKTKPSLHVRNLLLRADTPFLSKLTKLLAFYKSTIASTQDIVISALSLFRSPVRKDYLITFASRFLPANESESRTSLSAELLKLASIGLVLRDVISDVEAYSCHPIIRDYFRDAFLQVKPGETSSAARDLVSSRPDDIGLVGVAEIEPLLLAIETFIDLGDINSAKSFYAQRLKGGQLFLELGLPKDGKRMYEAFLRGMSGRSCKPDHGQTGSLWGSPDYQKQLDYGHFLGGAIEFSIQLGEHEDARRYIGEALKHVTGSRLFPPLRGMAQLSFREGGFQDAVDYANRALNSITRPGGESQTQTALARYEILKSQMYLSEIGAARSELQLIRGMRNELDLPDTQALLAASELHLCVWDRDLIRTKVLITRLRGLLDRTISQHIATEAKILVAEALAYRRRWNEAFRVLQEINSVGTRHNCPYETCRAQLALECVSYLKNGSFDEDRTERVKDISESTGFVSLNIDAMLLLHYAGRISGDEVEFFRQSNAYAWSPFLQLLSKAEPERQHAPSKD